MTKRLAVLFLMIVGTVAAAHSDDAGKRRAVGERLRNTVSEAEARELFRALRVEKYFARVTPDGGCVPRAEVAGFLLDGKGVRSRKLQLYCGSPTKLSPRTPWNRAGKIRWAAHVAPVVRVRRDDRVEEWVFDLLFPEPMPADRWKALLLPDGVRFTEIAREKANAPVAPGNCVHYQADFHDGEWDREWIEEQMKKLAR